jgi:hypothetical protein
MPPFLYGIGHEPRYLLHSNTFALPTTIYTNTSIPLHLIKHIHRKIKFSSHTKPDYLAQNTLTYLHRAALLQKVEITVSLLRACLLLDSHRLEMIACALLLLAIRPLIFTNSQMKLLVEPSHVA